MTSLQLFPKVDQKVSVPKEWGTGKFKDEVNVFVPGPPTWQYSGKPTDQFYRLTQLKLSNIRNDDELVPEAHQADMGRVMINRTFPADHPYASHIPRTALFPTFDSPEDPKRGVAARANKPISAETPSTAYDVQIVHKVKGFGDRREVQSFPKQSEKQGMVQVGEHGFNQMVKVHNGRQQYYPIPTKVVAPNLQARTPEMSISQTSANALRNIERDQWQTTYDRNHTGIGPINPNKLDNLADKSNFYDTFGIENDSIYPGSVNTFDPPRPQEGRIAKTLVPKPPPMATADAANAPEDPSYQRMQTLSEREEQRLLYGKDYVNLPDSSPEFNQQRWKELEHVSHSDPNLETLSNAKAQGSPDEVPFKPQSAEGPGEEDPDYLELSKEERDKKIQEMEAQNRWRVLESRGPDRDITTLNQKMAKVHVHEQPPTFYGHEGRYNEERAGLYKTSYSPEKMAYSMNALDVSGPEIMNTMHSHVGAVELPTKLNHDMKDAFRYSRSLSASQPNLSGDRRETREIINQHQNLKESQKRQLQPTVETARVKIQEGEVIQKESNMGASYNVHKFLQDQELGRFSRSEPLQVMSGENQNLNNVRYASSKKDRSVTFSDNVTVAMSLDSGQFRYSSAPTRGSPRVQAAPVREPVNTNQYSSTHAQYRTENDDMFAVRKEPSTVHDIQPREVSFKGMQTKPLPSLSPPSLGTKRPATCDPGTEYRDEFGSKGSNFIPSNLQHSMSFVSAYESMFPKHDIGYKHDGRFDWQPGHGQPRPQTTLLKIQDSFDKSTLRKQFHNKFKEANPDLRQNIVRGKKHNFYGLNGQCLRG